MADNPMIPFHARHRHIFRMTRIVPWGFVAGEDYTLSHDSLSSYTNMISNL
jgi:hypothetical protein